MQLQQPQCRHTSLMTCNSLAVVECIGDARFDSPWQTQSLLDLIHVLQCVLVGHVGWADVQLEVRPKVLKVIVVWQFWEEKKNLTGKCQRQDEHEGYDVRAVTKIKFQNVNPFRYIFYKMTVIFTPIRVPPLESGYNGKGKGSVNVPNSMKKTAGSFDRLW